MKILASILLMVSFIFAGTLEKGSVLEHKSFNDQFEKPLVITKDTKQLILAFSKDVGAVVKEGLDKNKNYLSNNNAIYLVDVSAVPGFVMSFFMLPKFKKYDYKMALIEDEKKAAYFPREEEKITIITLDNFKVTDIKFVDKI